MQLAHVQKPPSVPINQWASQHVCNFYESRRINLKVRISLSAVRWALKSIAAHYVSVARYYAQDLLFAYVL